LKYFCHAHKKRGSVTAFLFLAVFSVAQTVKADTSETSTTTTTIPESAPLQQENSIPTKAKPQTPSSPDSMEAESKISVEQPQPTNSLGFNVRIDAAYSGGGAVYQGFSIPSVRLSGFGEIGKNLNYRLSLGQTREFSTASLAQVLPVEAFVVLSVNPNIVETKTNLRLKAGLFSPSFNPIWTPDLSYINVPDFNETHRALFLGREAGAEAIFEPFKNWVEIAVGAFNGTGVFAQNTNNANAFTAYLRLNIPFQSWTMFLGTGNYFLTQASVGSVNYKSTRVNDVFFGVEIPDRNTQLYIDGFTSDFEDSVKNIKPVGGSAVLNLGINKWLGLFGRYEYSSHSPILSGCVRQFQAGPEIYFDPSVKSFINYTELETGGTKERSLSVRLRVNI